VDQLGLVRANAPGGLCGDGGGLRRAHPGHRHAHLPARPAAGHQPLFLRDLHRLGCVGICLLTEWIYANGIAIVAGAASGFCTLIIAHILSLDGDTMEMLVAVLDTNFWLATT